MVMSASFLRQVFLKLLLWVLCFILEFYSLNSGLRWTLSQMVMQKSEMGLANPVDMMYHIQPWMIATLLPFSLYFEGTIQICYSALSSIFKLVNPNRNLLRPITFFIIIFSRFEFSNDEGRLSFCWHLSSIHYSRGSFNWSNYCLLYGTYWILAGVLHIQSNAFCIRNYKGILKDPGNH